MADSQAVRPPVSYWLISVFLTLWGFAYAWLVTSAFLLATPDDFEALVASGRISAGYRDYIALIPPWVIGLSFIAAITRLGGGMGLLLRKRWSQQLYFASCLCVCVLMFRAFVIADVASVIDATQIAIEALFLTLSFFAPWYAHRSNKLGLLT